MTNIASNLGSPLGKIGTIETEWADFVTAHGISEPDRYLESVWIEPWVLEHIQIGLTNSCNLDCNFCFLHAGNALNGLRKASMKADEFVDFCSRNAPIREVIFTNYGEVFEFQGALDVMETVVGDVGRFAFNTNALMLDRIRIERLRALPIDRLSVSVEASDSRTYSQYRRKGQFARLLDNVSALAASLGDRLLLTAIVSTGNVASLLGMPALFAPLGVRRIDVQNLMAHEHFHEDGMSPLSGSKLEEFAVSFMNACEDHGLEGEPWPWHGHAGVCSQDQSETRQNSSRFRPLHPGLPIEHAIARIRPGLELLVLLCPSTVLSPGPSTGPERDHQCLLRVDEQSHATDEGPTARLFGNLLPRNRP